MTGIFEFEDEEIQNLWDDLWYSLDGTEPCYDPLLVDAGVKMVGDTDTDLYVEGWSAGNASKAQAEKLCAPCHVKDKCAAYAIANKEPYGIWGGTRPKDRGIDVSKKRRFHDARNTVHAEHDRAAGTSHADE